MLAYLEQMNRRQSLRAMAAMSVAAGVAGCADLVPQGLGLALTPSRLTDPSVYNFALNLEFLEAEYYLRGLTGEGLPPELIGDDPGPVTGGRRVAFATPYVREFIAEIANDETNHVRFLRRSARPSPLVELGRPALDLQNSFRLLGRTAGLGENFDPFADEASFLLGAFLFEDGGVNDHDRRRDLIARHD